MVATDQRAHARVRSPASSLPPKQEPAPGLEVVEGAFNAKELGKEADFGGGKGE